MDIRALVIAAVALALSGCGSAGVSRSAAGEAEPRTVSAHGLSVELAPGWDGRIYRPSPAFAVVVEAATLKLPAPGVDDEGVQAVHRAMRAGDVYVRAADIGPPPPRLVEAFECRCRPTEGWEREDGPIELRRGDLLPAGKGVPDHLGHAQRAVVVGRHALMLWVEFGARPVTASDLERANEVLRTLTVD